MKTHRSLLAFAIFAASLGSQLAACSSDKPNSSGIDDSCGNCYTPDSSSPKDAGKDVSADADAADLVEASDPGDASNSDVTDSAPAYTGPTAEASGTVFSMLSPKFETNASSGSQIFRPAAIRIAAFGKEYTGQFNPGEGFTIKDLPLGEFPVLVSDIDAGNAILDTVTTAKVLESGNIWELPAATRPTFVIIYGTLASPLVIDAYRAQAIVSFEDCASKGSGRLAGVKVVAPTDSEGALYNTAAGWINENPVGTASDGTAIIANIPADPFPGKIIMFNYVVNSKTYENVEVRVIRGAVSRLRVIHPCE